MNSFEIKKILWGFSLIFFFGLIFSSLFAYQHLSLPVAEIKPFVYNEPVVNSEQDIGNRVTRAEVEKEFGLRENIVIKSGLPPPPEPTDISKTENKIENINDVFSLEVILGRLVFIKIKKDKQMKCVVNNDEIINDNGEVLGVLKEVHEDFVLILFQNNVERLSFDKVMSLYSHGNTVLNTMLGTSLISTEPKKTNTNNLLNNQIKKFEKEEIKQSFTIDGGEFEVIQVVDSDGMTHRKLPKELALKMETREFKSKCSSANSYDLEYKSNGILIKNIRDTEIKKLFKAFGISDSDIILSVNDQSLGNKTEDDLIAIYHQLKSSAKYATIELLRNNTPQKFRVSTNKN